MREARWYLILAALTALLYLIPSPIGPWWGWVLKPLTTLLLVAAAARGGAGPYRRLMLIGLLFSVAGDIFLMLPGDWFIPGLAAFLCAHLLYTIAFYRRCPGWGTQGWGVAVGLLAIGLFMYWQFLPNLLPQGPIMLIAVAAYVLAILLMTLRAIVTREVLIASGALLFLLSDAILGWNRFAAPVPAGALWIMLTYWSGQGLLAASVARR